MTCTAIELGARVMRALHAENDGKERYRKLAIALRWYEQFKPAA